MVMRIDGNRLGCGAEKGAVGRVTRHCLGVAAATHMAVEAHDAVGAGHDEMEVVANEQDPESVGIAQLGDEPVKVRLPRKIDTLHRFVEDEKVGVAEQGTGEERPLQLPAGEGRDLIIRQPGYAEALRDGRDTFGVPAARRESQKAPYAQGKRGVKRETLGHVADPQVGPPPNGSDARSLQSEDNAEQGCLAGAVRSDDGHNLGGSDREGYLRENRAAAESHANASQLHQLHHA